MNKELEELKKEGWEEMWEQPALKSAKEAFTLQAIRSGTRGYSGPEFKPWLDGFAEKIYRAGQASGRKETADKVESWASARMRGGYHNSELRLVLEAARSNDQ